MQPFDLGSACTMAVEAMRQGCGGGQEQAPLLFCAALEQPTCTQSVTSADLSRVVVRGVPYKLVCIIFLHHRHFTAAFRRPRMVADKLAEGWYMYDDLHGTAHIVHDDVVTMSKNAYAYYFMKVA